MLDKVIEEGARKFKAEFEPVFNNVVNRIATMERNISAMKDQLDRIENALQRVQR